MNLFIESSFGKIVNLYWISALFKLVRWSVCSAFHITIVCTSSYRKRYKIEETATKSFCWKINLKEMFSVNIYVCNTIIFAIYWWYSCSRAILIFAKNIYIEQFFYAYLLVHHASYNFQLPSSGNEILIFRIIEDSSVDETRHVDSTYTFLRNLL